MAGLGSISTLAKVLGNLNTPGNTSPMESVDATQGALSSASSATLSTNQSVRRIAVDQATVSAAGGLVAQVSTTSDVRTEKVAQLQAAIASGTYRVPASEVANKMVEHLLS